MTSKVNKLTLTLGILLFSLFCQGEVIDFRSDEIPSESVTPVLDSNMAVKKKIIHLEDRLELGLLTGSIIDEMFYNNVLWGLQTFYNFDSESAVGLKYANRLAGLSSYSEQFQNTSMQLNFNKTPAPTSVFTASYRWSFLYGKISLSKDLILPVLFSTETDLGISQIGKQQLPYTSFGITHRIFIKRQWGVGFSYRLLLYQTLNPVSLDITNSSTTPAPAESSFSKKIQLSQSLDLTLSYLF